jgi:hypothetical protein
VQSKRARGNIARTSIVIETFQHKRFFPNGVLTMLMSYLIKIRIVKDSQGEN